jgi:transposase
VRVTVRPKYALPGRPSLGVLQEPMPPTLVEGAKFDASFLAHLAVEKFQYHLPLYRIAEKLAGRDLPVTRQTLAQLLTNCGLKTLPLFHLMRDKLLADGCLFVDETPVKLQAPGKCREARMWVYVNALPGAPPYHVYQFTSDRSHRHPLAFLATFRGTIHADAFGAYEKLDQDPNKPIRWAACWAHARRKFEEAQSGDADLRAWVLRQIRYLFLFERIAWAHDADTRRRIRAEQQTPIVDALFARLRQTVAAGALLPKSQLADAIGYLLARPANFRHYLTDPNLRLDNNTAERALRKLTIGRKNWLFVGSPRAGEAMAALLSLVQTCRALAIDPQTYLEDTFRRLLDHPANRLAELLPDRWQAARTGSPQA